MVSQLYTSIIATPVYVESFYTLNVVIIYTHAHNTCIYPFCINCPASFPIAALIGGALAVFILIIGITFAVVTINIAAENCQSKERSEAVSL